MKLPAILALAAIIGLSSCSRDSYTRLDRKKTVGRDFVKINDKMYAQQGEVSNKQYSNFLAALKTAGKEDSYNLYNFDSTAWKKALSINEPFVLYYHHHPAYYDYPAVNISYEGAVAYCNWLTEEYNKNPKRAFKKVIFRLPMEHEWQFAARGGGPYNVFPWGGPFMRNSRGMHLANFRTVPEASIKDTVINDEEKVIADLGHDFHTGVAGSLNDVGITAPVQSYFPNRYGIYNMAGNVSEMLAEKGRTKGGNWNSLGYYLRIDAPDEFGGQMVEPSPYVGFRVFAEIVEK